METTSHASAHEISIAVNKIINKDPQTLSENGNKDSRTFIVQRDLLCGAISRVLGVSMLPDEVRNAHERGAIHIHDLDRSPFLPMPNCSLPDFEFLLSHGFQLGNARITTPQSVSVATTLLVQLIGAISGEQYGGISIHEIDKLLEPYAEKTFRKNVALYEEVIKDRDNVTSAAIKKTSKDIYDAIQAFEYQINTLTTAAAQTPFISVSFGLGTSWLCKQIQSSLLDVRKKGMDGKTAIFPKLLYLIDNGVNHSPGDPNYDVKKKAMECSRERIYPDMISVPRLRDLKDGQTITPMGCRSFLHPWQDLDGRYVVTGRNNLGVVSVNLPHIALEARGSRKIFFNKLDKVLDLACSALHVREDGILKSDLEAAPILYTQGGLGDPTGKTSVRQFYDGSNKKRSSISLGYIGIHNAMVALTGVEDWQSDSNFVALSHKILTRFSRKASEAQDDFVSYVSVYATPSESLCDRFARLDVQEFGSIEGVNDKGYYENSFHFPSDRHTDPISKIQFEAQYPSSSRGGFMHYVEAPNLHGNPDAFEAIWDTAFDKLCYFGINSPADSCFACGFKGEFNCDDQGYFCPSCNNRDEKKASVVRRLCGYLGSPMSRPVVHGKQEEINSRVKHL